MTTKMMVSQRGHRESISTRVRRATRNTPAMGLVAELKGKIKMKDRQQHSVQQRSDESREQNEQKIAELRIINARLRKAFQEAIHADEYLLNEIFSRRKRLALAMRRRSVDFAINDIDNSICNLKRKHNALKYKRTTLQQRKEKLQDETAIEQNSKPDAIPPELNLRMAKLQNSINTIDMKLISGAQMRILYSRIKRTIEKQIIQYPKMLNDVEKKIFTQRFEVENLMEMKKGSYKERDLTLKEKLNLEVQVRELRHEREASIRVVRKKVKHGRAALYHPQIGGKVVHFHVETAAPPAKPVMSEERQRKFEDYLKYAAMLEVVTGVSFSNRESLIDCFEAQKKSSASLQKQVERRRKSLANSKILLSNYQRRYEKLMYTFKKKRKDQKINDLKEKIAAGVDRKEELAESRSRILLVLREVDTWMRLFVVRLQSTSQILDISSTESFCSKIGGGTLDSSTVRLSTSMDHLNLSEVFHVVKDILYRLLSRDLRWTSAVSSVDAMFARQKNEKVLLNRNNNRILRGLLERKPSEEFEYNTPTNEEYKSRESIKLQSNLIQRRGQA